MGKWSSKRQRQRRACIGSTKDINIAEPINTNLLSTLKCRPLLHVTTSKQASKTVHISRPFHPSEISATSAEIHNSSLVAGLRHQLPCLPYTMRSFLLHFPLSETPSSTTSAEPPTAEAADGACAILQAPRVQLCSPRNATAARFECMLHEHEVSASRTNGRPE